MIIRPLIAALLVAGTAPAIAQSNDSIQIQTADLNLESAAGRATLDRRLARAERQFCGTAGQITGSRIRVTTLERSCKAEFHRQVYAQIPSLSRKG